MVGLVTFRRRPGRSIAWLIGLLALAWLPGAVAQAAAPEPAAAVSQISDEQLEELVATLEDEAERDKLIRTLRGLIEVRQTQEAPEGQGLGGRILSLLAAKTEALTGQLGQVGQVLTGLPRLADEIWRQSRDPEVLGRWAEVAAKLVLILLAAFAAEWLLRLLLSRARRAIESRRIESWPTRVVLLLARTILDLLPILAFAAAAYGILAVAEPRPVTRLVALAIVNANVLVRIVLAVARLLLTPQAASLRLFPVTDETANYAFIWTRRITSVAVYGYFLAEAALLLGLLPGAHAFLLRALGLGVATMIVVLLLQCRQTVSHWLAGGPVSEVEGGPAPTLRRRFAEIWHVLGIVYVYAIYGVWALGVEGGFQFLARATVLTAIIFLAAWLVTSGLRYFVERGFRLRADLKLRFPTLEERANRYLFVVHRVSKIIVNLLAGLLVLQIWGLDVAGWLFSETGRAVAARLVTILLILAGAWVVWEVISGLVQRLLEPPGEEAGDRQPSARMRTLLPLFRNTVRVVIAVFVALTVLSELGIDIAPLLAGAGVIGLAVGFGAQTLVKDVIAGVFILLEETIAVGDVVTLGSNTGVVESLSIRTVRLRDLTGTVHTIPFGEVTSVLNLTKDFSYAVMDVGVAYREDVDEVIEVLKEVGAEVQADETFGPLILEPLEVLGLDSFSDSAVNIRVRFKTVPVKQWMVRREFNRRMKRRFDELGIEIPFPHQTLYFGVDKQGEAPAARLRISRDVAGPDPGARPPETEDPREQKT
jgi:small conductance mechanosensitive channel